MNEETYNPLYATVVGCGPFLGKRALLSRTDDDEDNDADANGYMKNF